MHVQKALLLEFNCAHICLYVTKNPLYSKVMDERVFVHVEDAYTEVWSIEGALAVEKFICYFRPKQVIGESYEEVESLIMSSKSHSVLKSLIHISRATNIR